MTTTADYGLASTDLVAFAPCGCWFAVMVESMDFLENGERTAEFARDAQRSDKHGRAVVKRMPHEEFCALKNGQNGDLGHGCDHDPQWGGMEPTHRDCPRCHKEVQLKQDGTLRAHKWGWSTCDQEPWERTTGSGG